MQQAGSTTRQRNDICLAYGPIYQPAFLIMCWRPYIWHAVSQERRPGAVGNPPYPCTHRQFSYLYFPVRMAASKINAVDKLTITFLVDNSIEWFVLVTVVARSRSKQSACR